MKRTIDFDSAHGAFTLVEIMVAAGSGLLLLAVVASASIAVQRSISATSRSATSMINENRLLDYVAQDLRRAVRVGTISSGMLMARMAVSVTENDEKFLAVA